MAFRIPTLRPAGRGRAWLAVTLLVSGTARGAQELPERSDVLVAGPWLLAPTLTAGWSNDTNVFYQSQITDPTADQVFHVMPEVKALHGGYDALKAAGMINGSSPAS